MQNQSNTRTAPVPEVQATAGSSRLLLLLAVALVLAIAGSLAAALTVASQHGGSALTLSGTPDTHGRYYPAIDWKFLRTAGDSVDLMCTTGAGTYVCVRVTMEETKQKAIPREAMAAIGKYIAAMYTRDLRTLWTLLPSADRDSITQAAGNLDYESFDAAVNKLTGDTLPFASIEIRVSLRTSYVMEDGGYAVLPSYVQYVIPGTSYRQAVIGGDDGSGTLRLDGSGDTWTVQPVISNAYGRLEDIWRHAYSGHAYSEKYLKWLSDDTVLSVEGNYVTGQLATYYTGGLTSAGKISPGDTICAFRYEDSPVFEFVDTESGFTVFLQRAVDVQTK